MPLSPHWLESAVGSKLQKAKGTTKVPWHWDKVHQRAFNHVKATIKKGAVMAYPNYSKVFEIYMDASSKQLRVIILLKITGIQHSSVRNSPLCNASTVSPKLNYLIVKTLKGSKGCYGANLYKCLLITKIS